MNTVVRFTILFYDILGKQWRCIRQFEIAYVAHPNTETRRLHPQAAGLAKLPLVVTPFALEANTYPTGADEETSDCPGHSRVKEQSLLRGTGWGASERAISRGAGSNSPFPVSRRIFSSTALALSCRVFIHPVSASTTRGYFISNVLSAEEKFKSSWRVFGEEIHGFVYLGVPDDFAFPPGKG